MLRTYVDAAYCYRREWCGLSLLSVCHDRKLCKNGFTDRDAGWGTDLGGPKEACVRWGCTLVPPGEYNRTVHMLRWCTFFKAALCNRACNIYFYSVVSSFFLLLFLASSQRSEIGCLPHFHTWCGHLECRSESCCTRLAENTGRRKSPKIRHLGTIPQLCRAISSQLRHVSTIGKKTC